MSKLKLPWKKPSKATSKASERKLRTRTEVNEDYNRACNEAGDLQYRVIAMSQRIDELTKIRGVLNQEMAEIEKAEQEALPTAPPSPEDVQPPGPQGNN